MKLILLLSLIVAANSQDIQEKNWDLLTNDVTVQKGGLDKIEPTEPYLQGWAKKFTELPDIPLCKDVPIKTKEELLIESKCPPKGEAPTICLNIRLFGVLRNMCHTECEQHQAKWIRVMDKMVEEDGLLKFISVTTDLQLFQRIEEETEEKLTNFQKKNIRDLWLYHIVDLIKAEEQK